MDTIKDGFKLTWIVAGPVGWASWRSSRPRFRKAKQGCRTRQHYLKGPFKLKLVKPKKMSQRRGCPFWIE